MLSASSIPPGAFAVATADQARLAVNFLAGSGYDFLKEHLINILLACLRTNAANRGGMRESRHE